MKAGPISPINGLLTQFASAVKARGTPVTLRRATQTGGPNPAQMPPIVENPEVASLIPAGSAAISISASAASGALIAGDQIAVAGVLYTVQAQVSSQGAMAPGFLNVPVLPLVPLDITAGTPVYFTFSLDQTIFVTVGSYAQGLMDGNLIQSSDLQFILASWDLVAGGLITPPSLTDQLIFNGAQLSIVAITPKLILGTVAGYSIQARA